MKLSNKTLLYYLVPAFLLLGLSAPFFYYLAQEIYLEEVDEDIQLRKREFMVESYHQLQENEIVLWNRFNRDVRILPDTVKQIKNQITEQLFYDSLESESEPYRVLYSDIHINGHPYTLMIKMNLVESDEIIETTALLYLIVLAVLLMGFILVSGISSRYLWRPFYKTLSLVESFDIRQQQPVHFDRVSTQEFKQLNRALQKLIDQNITAFRIQKEFAENASHELQTPLAVFQSKLDLLLQSPGLTQEQAQLIQQLYESVSRLVRLNKNLLLLAQMENRQFAERESVNISGLLEEVLPYFLEQAEEKKLHLTTQFDDPVTVVASKGLTEIMINNLLLNAIRHNTENGSISIVVSRDRLIVSNTGNPEPLDQKKLFQRFSKFNTYSGGSGLGLAIIKKIAEYNGWTVQYSFEAGKHVFTVHF